MAGNGRRRGRSREELVVAATEYAIEHGLSALSLRPLAAALGISHRTLLYHFGSKEALLQAILREARTQERLRAVSRTDERGEPLPAPQILRETWQYLSGPREHAFWRFYFEVHGLALQEPERFEDLLHGGVEDWLEMAEGVFLRDGVPPAQASALATFILAVFRGLMLDLLSTGDRERVDSGFALLAAIADSAAAAREADGE